MADRGERLPAEERRQQILQCAIKVFARSNYEKARVADIAAAVGISEAAIYKHFPSKKSLYLEVLQFMSDRLLLRLEEVIQKEPDALKALTAMVKAFSSPNFNPPDEVKVRGKAISDIDDPEIAQRLQTDHIRFIFLLRSIVERGVQEGTIRRDLDIETMVLLLDAAGMFIDLLKLLSLEGQMAEDMGMKMAEPLIQMMRA